MNEVQTIIALLNLPYNYHISKYGEITIRRLRDNQFCVSLHPLGRSEVPEDDSDQPWEQVFLNIKPAAEFFVNKCHERYGHDHLVPMPI